MRKHAAPAEILDPSDAADQALVIEQFQQERAAVLRPELQTNKEIERLRDSRKSGNDRGPDHNVLFKELA